LYQFSNILAIKALYKKTKTDRSKHFICEELQFWSGAGWWTVLL